MSKNYLTNYMDENLFKRVTLRNRWIPHTPTLKQAQFLALDIPEAFYGGAAGGGKTDALLMGALQFVEVKDYTALLLRRTYPELMLPKGLLDRANEWLGGTDAHWDGKNYTYEFPVGAKIVFGYVDNERDKYRYQSSEFQFIGFDELTEFTESQYSFLFSRLRRLEGTSIPLRMRSASNPGGVGHDWVKQRFLVEGPKYDRVFIPARLEDNPFLDQQAYLNSLSRLDYVTRQQLQYGDWDIGLQGNKFKHEWFQIVEGAPAEAKRVRYWDLASTEPKEGQDPDYTVGARMAFRDGIAYVEDVQRFRLSPQGVESRIVQTAELDGKAVDIWMEQEPGSAGEITIDHYARHVLVGFTFRGSRTTGTKEIRANPLSAASERGNVKLVRGSWIRDFLDEVCQFPLGAHDDQVDASSGAYEKLTMRTKGAFM